MNRQRVAMATAVCLLACVARSDWAMAQPAATDASRPTIRREDVVSMIDQWKQRRQDALNRAAEIRSALQSGNRIGPSASELNKDLGYAEGARWIVNDLEKLLRSSPSDAQLPALLQAASAAWQRQRGETSERVEVNQNLIARSGRTGVVAEQINRDYGTMNALDMGTKDVIKTLGISPQPASSVAGPVGASRPLTPAQILPLLPKGVVSAEDLERFLERERSLELGAAAKAELRGLFARQRERQVAELLDAAMRELDETALVLSSQPPSPLVADIARGPMAVQVLVDEASLQRSLESLRGKLLRLAGATPAFRVRYGWTGPDGDVVDAAQDASRHTFQIREIKPHRVSVVRWVTLHCDVRGDDAAAASVRDVVNTTFAARGSIQLDVRPPAFPLEIGGTWSGTLTIRQAPLVDALRAGATAERSQNSGAEEFLAGCQIPLEAFEQLAGKIRAAKDRPLKLTVTIRADNPAGGTLVLLVQPPPEWGVQAPQPVSLTYRYVEGTLAAQWREGDARLQMRAAFAPAPTGWQFSGNWEAAGLERGQWVAALSGNWAAANSAAR